MLTVVVAKTFFEDAVEIMYTFMNIAGYIFRKIELSSFPTFVLGTFGFKGSTFESFAICKQIVWL